MGDSRAEELDLSARARPEASPSVRLSRRFYGLGPCAIIEGMAHDWKSRLADVVENMREISMQTDPQEMVRGYTARLRRWHPTDGFLSISRRDTKPGFYRIARSHLWGGERNPWTERDKLPVLRGGLIGELLTGNEPRVIDDLHVADDDPAREYFANMRSALAIPIYDRGEALNLVIQMQRKPAGFDPEQLPWIVWQSNLFGRATHNLVVSRQLETANRELEREAREIADIQNSLLPSTLPTPSHLKLAAHYAASTYAGGDYYDFFELPGDRLGILIADVCGHGTPAAVLMAVTHAIAHSFAADHDRPGALLQRISETLAARYTRRRATFVTACYGVYDGKNRSFRYALAGHPPPRLKRCDNQTLEALDGSRHPPLGLFPETEIAEAEVRLRPGDQLVFYTDGVTEARRHDGELFGVARIDQALAHCDVSARGLCDTLVAAVGEWTGARPQDDDITLVVAKVL